MEEQILETLAEIEDLNNKFEEIFNSDQVLNKTSELELKKIKIRTKKIYTELRAIRTTMKSLDSQFLVKTSPNYLNMINQINQRVEKLTLSFNEDINIPFINIVEKELIAERKEVLLSESGYKNIKNTLSISYKERDTSELLKKSRELISFTLNEFLTKFEEKIDRKLEDFQDILERHQIEQNKYFQNFIVNQDSVINFLKKLEHPQNINELSKIENIANILNQIHDESLDLNKKLDLIGAEVLKNKCSFSIDLKNVYFKKERYIIEENFETEIAVNPLYNVQCEIEYVLINQQPKNCFLDEEAVFTEKYENFYKIPIQKNYDKSDKFIKLNIFAPADEGILQIIIKGAILFFNNRFPFLSDTRFSLKRGKIRREKLKTFTKKLGAFVLSETLSVVGLFMPP